MSWKNLFSRVMHQVKGAANDVADTTYDPIRSLRQVIRDIDSQTDEMSVQYLDVSQKLYGIREKFQSKQSDYDDYVSRAKKAKADGNPEEAMRLSEMAVRVNGFLEQRDNSIEAMESHLEEIKSNSIELQNTKESLELELSLLESEQTINENSYEYSTKVRGAGNQSNSIDRLVEQARSKVGETRNRAKAARDTAEVFNNNDQADSKAAKASASAQDLFDSL